MAFIETPRFPEAISYRSTGGPVWKTQVVQTASGREQRNQTWSESLRRWDALNGARSDADLDQLQAWFQVTAGMANGFRWKDWKDYTATTSNGSGIVNTTGLGNGTADMPDRQILQGKQIALGNHAVQTITHQHRQVAYAVTRHHQRRVKYRAASVNGQNRLAHHIRDRLVQRKICQRNSPKHVMASQNATEPIRWVSEQNRTNLLCMHQAQHLT